MMPVALASELPVWKPCCWPYKTPWCTLECVATLKSSRSYCEYLCLYLKWTFQRLKTKGGFALFCPNSVICFDACACGTLWQYPHRVIRGNMLDWACLETRCVWSSDRDFELVKFYPGSLFWGEGSGNWVHFCSGTRQSGFLQKARIHVFILQG